MEKKKAIAKIDKTDSTPAQLIYYVTEPYNPQDPDEERIPWNDAAIDFDWEIRNR